MPGLIRTQSIIDISAPGGGPDFPNRPPNFTNSSQINFSNAVPSAGANDQVDNAISGSADWLTIFFKPDGVLAWTQTTDATATLSPPNIWRGHFTPGFWPPQIGHGIGNVFTRAMNHTNRIYMSHRFYVEFPDTSFWHPVSNKFVNMFSNNSTILMQLREQSHWRHCEELGNLGQSFFVDNDVDQPGEDHIPGQIDNRVVPINQWVHLELLIDIPNHIWKVWQDGVLTTNAAPTFASTEINEFGIFTHRGGGGETLTTDLYYRYDHLFIAW